MLAVFVIHAPQDEPFVVERLIRPLPVLGYDGWISAARLGAENSDSQGVVTAMASAAAILAVLSPAALSSAIVREQLIAASRSGRPLVPVRLESTPARVVGEGTGEGIAAAPSEPWLAAAAADAVSDRVLWTDLAALLPSALTSDLASSAVGTTAIPWPEDVFSLFLGHALERHDYNRGQTWVTLLERSLRDSPRPYPTLSARRDLAALRSQRQFVLMRRYAEAVLASGTDDLRVRRQYAQALIELGDFDEAIRVLERMSTDAPETDEEWSEARGLLGRVYKQQYVNDPQAPDGPARLRRAIETYRAVFRVDRERVWHGINTVSCLRRAARDGTGVAEDVSGMVREILETLDKREAGGVVYVWDLATRVEAELALDDYDEAMRAVDRYLGHPDMQAFEVSSTYRQFREVLRLDQDPRAAALMDRLWRAVERHRAAGMPSSMAARPDDDAVETKLRPLVVRVADPDWQPSGVADIDVKARLGTVVSVMGTEATLKGLMQDPLVVSVAESRPVKRQECVRSVPFINVTDQFPGLAGPYTEKGDRALVAIIDNGIDVLHGAFLDGHGNSRIVGIWDQRDRTGPPPPGFDMGTFHTRDQIAAYVSQNSGIRLDGAAGAPAAATSLPPRLASRNADGHGTHVASIAAGRAVGSFAGGVAPEAQLLIVISASDEPVGYSHAHLAALSFIDRQATELNMPVVVNVSQGMNAGAHDGKSLLEVGFDEFSSGGRKPGRAIVKSAGNEGDTRGHAEIALAADGADTFEWTCASLPWFRDRLELWWNSANQYRFRLASPIGQRSEWASLMQPQMNGRLGNVPYAIQLVRRHVDNGDSRLTLDLGDGFTPIPPGTWAIEVESVKMVEQGSIHAWIERRDDSRSTFVRNDRQGMTLSIPGTAYSVITVSAVDASRPIRVGTFSSYGPTRDDRQKPNVCAPGVEVIAARGGTFDAVIPMSGTSMAAPHITGAIALLLSKSAKAGEPWPSATQITTALRQNTINYSVWTPSQGWGVVDVAALLNAL